MVKTRRAVSSSNIVSAIFARVPSTFPALELGVDVVSSGDVADDNSSDDSWGDGWDDWPGLLDEDD